MSKKIELSIGLLLIGVLSVGALYCFRAGAMSMDRTAVHTVPDMDDTLTYDINDGEGYEITTGVPAVAGVVQFEGHVDEQYVVARTDGDEGTPPPKLATELTHDQYAWIQYHAAAIAAGIHDEHGLLAAIRADQALLITRGRWEDWNE